MWSYYELITAQSQADRFNDAGYTLTPTAGLECPQDVICRALVQQSQIEKAERQKNLYSALITLIHASKAALRGPTVAG